MAKSKHEASPAGVEREVEGVVEIELEEGAKWINVFEDMCDECWTIYRLHELEGFDPSQASNRFYVLTSFDDDESDISTAAYCLSEDLSELGYPVAAVRAVED